MANIHQAPLLFTPKPSKHLNYIIGLLHFLAVLAISQSALTLVYQIMVSLIFIINGVASIRYFENRRYTIKYDAAGGWQMAEKHHFVAITVLPSSVTTPLVTFLHLELPIKQTHISTIVGKAALSQQKNLLIMADSLPANRYRQLLVTLKTAWKAKPLSPLI